MADKSNTPIIQTAQDLRWAILTLQNAQSSKISPPEKLKDLTMQQLLDAVHAYSTVNPGTGDEGISTAVSVLDNIITAAPQMSPDIREQFEADAQKVQQIFSDKKPIRNEAFSHVYERISQYAIQRSQPSQTPKGVPRSTVNFIKTKTGIQAVQNKAEAVAKKVTSQVVSKGVTAIVAGIPFLQAFAPVIGKFAGFVYEKLLFPLIRKSKEIIQSGLGLVGLGLLLGSPLLIGAGVTAGVLGFGLGGTAALTSAMSSIANIFPTVALEGFKYLGVTLAGVLLGGTLLVTLILFIINSGAYIVPQNTQGPVTGSPLTDANTITGSCPIPGGVVYVGSFRGANGPYAHGSNEYWNQVSTPATRCYALPIPLTACRRNNDAASYCYTAGSSCVQYGFAADIRYTQKPAPLAQYVYFPQIGGQTLTWTRSGTIAGCGYGYTYTATNGTTTHEMLFMHLAPGAAAGGDSGQPIGRLLTYAENSCTLSASNEHVHVEWRINGQYVRPDNLCSGGGGIVVPTDPGDIDGVAVRVNLSSSTLDDVLASVSSDGFPSGYNPAPTCTWAGSAGTEYAVNANFYSGSTPIGPAGDNSTITTYFDHRNRNYRTFYITEGSNPSYGIQQIDPGDTFDTSNYRLAVTGVNWDNFTPDGMIASRPRTIIGLRGSTLSIIVMRSATPGQARAYMNNQGFSDNDFFFLDGGGSTTYCDGTNMVFNGNAPSGPRVIPVNFGVRPGANAQVSDIGDGL